VELERLKGRGSWWLWSEQRCSGLGERWVLLLWRGRYWSGAVAGGSVEAQLEKRVDGAMVTRKQGRVVVWCRRCGVVVWCGLRGAVVVEGE
jgi:hypothetical protein